MQDKRSDDILCSHGCAIPEIVHYGAGYICTRLGFPQPMCPLHRDDWSCCRKMTNQELKYYSGRKARNSGVWVGAVVKGYERRPAAVEGDKIPRKEKLDYVHVPDE